MVEKDQLRRTLTLMWVVLKNKDFFPLWLARLISRLGDGVHEIALAWLVLELTGSALTMGATLAISALPNLLFGLPAGDLVDQLPRRLLMVGCELFRGLLVLLIPLAYFWGIFELWMVYGVAFLTSTAETLFNPSVKSTIPNLVKEKNLNSANSLNQMTTSFSSLFGLSGGGALVAISGAVNAFFIDSFSFFLSGLLISFIDIEHEEIGEVKRIFKTIPGRVKEGLMYVKKSKFLARMVTLAVGLNFVGMPVAVIIPYLIKNQMGASSLWYGLLMASISIGTLLGSLYVGNIDVPTGRAIILGIAGMGCGLLCFVLFYQLFFVGSPMPEKNFFLLLAFWLVLFGFSNVFANVPVNSLIQSKTSDEKRGRVMSILRTGALAAVPFSYGLSGFFIERLGVVTIIYGMGSLTILGALLAYLSTPIREASL